MRIRKLHYQGGLVISIFVFLHLFNHLSSLFGAQWHIQIMDFLRPIYRNIFIESIILITVCSQVASGLKLFLVAKKIAINRFEKLHIVSGLYLSFFLIIHVSAVLVGRFILHLDTNFYFGVAGLNTFPYNLFFIPYYGLAIFLFFAHLAAIHYKKMKSKILYLTPWEQSNAILIFGAFFTTAIFYGLTNHFRGVNIPIEYYILIGK